jgi:hypothetical protein
MCACCARQLTTASHPKLMDAQKPPHPLRTPTRRPHPFHTHSTPGPSYPLQTCTAHFTPAGSRAARHTSRPAMRPPPPAGGPPTTPASHPTTPASHLQEAVQRGVRAAQQCARRHRQPRRRGHVCRVGLGWVGLGWVGSGRVGSGRVGIEALGRVGNFYGGWSGSWVDDLKWGRASEMAGCPAAALRGVCGSWGRNGERATGATSGSTRPSTGGIAREACAASLKALVRVRLAQTRAGPVPAHLPAAMPCGGSRPGQPRRAADYEGRVPNGAGCAA